MGFLNSESQKQELLETIRIQQKENALFDQLVQKMLISEEIEKVRGCAEWNDQTNQYQIPLFVIKDKKVVARSLA